MSEQYMQGAAGQDTLVLGVEASGTISSTGSTKFKIHLEAGQQYAAQVHIGSNDGFAFRITDAKGEQYPYTSLLQGADGAFYLFMAYQSTGDYYAELGPSYGAASSYSITVRQVQDDYSSAFALATPLTLGLPRSAVLETPMDNDLFKISLQAGVTYEFASSNDDQVHVAVRLIDAAFKTVADTSFGNIGTYTPTTSGDYYVGVNRYSNRHAEPVPYKVVVNTLAAELAAGGATAAALSVGTTFAATLDGSAHERDWYAVQLAANKEYSFGLSDAEGDIARSHIRLFGSQGELIFDYDYSYNSRGLTERITTAGTYYIEIVPFENTIGNYRLAVTDITPDTTAPKLLSGAYAGGLHGKVMLGFDEKLSVSLGQVTLTGSDGSDWPLPQGSLADDARTIVLSTSYFLKPGVSYTWTLPVGSVHDQVGNRVMDEIKYTFTTPVASVGTPGDDIFAGTGKGAIIDGGAGLDTVYYAQNWGDVSIRREGDHFVIKPPSATGTDTLVNIERVQMTRIAIALDIDGHGGQAYRLYQAAFGREPDQGGVGYWIQQLDQGMSLHDVAESFVHSTEFINKYGASTSNAAFVDLLYHNVLHRGADESGAAFWLRVLQEGASRADVLSSFSESPENQAALIGVIGNGFSYIPYV